MSVLDVAAFAFGALGFVFGAVCYRELFKWARQCQTARIAIAHKQRVKLNAPLVEWLSWANALERDEASTGRVVYRNGHASVAILRPRKTSRTRAGISWARRARARRGRVGA